MTDFQAILLLAGLFVSFSVHADTVPAAQTNGTSHGWGKLQISPQVFLSLNYRNQFRVTVYRSENPVINATDYYYSPALILVPETVECYTNQATGKNDVGFETTMWNPEYEAFVRDSINLEVGSYISSRNIRVLPIEEIRVDAGRRAYSDFDNFNNWDSYAGQPSRFSFRLPCASRNVCNDTAVSLRQNPQEFLQHLLVHYSLVPQRSFRRTIQITASHLRSSKRFNKLLQQFPDRNPVFVTEDYVNEIIREVASNVMTTETMNDEFISQDQAVAIAGVLRQAMEPRTISSSIFNNWMWESVLWDQESARPDRISNTLNKYYSNSSEEMKTVIKETLAKAQSPSAGNREGSSVLGLSVGAQAASASSASFASQDEKDHFIAMMNEAASKSQWNGEKFETIPLQLIIVDTAKFLQCHSSTVAAVQMRATKATAELSSKINFVTAEQNIPGNTTVTHCEGTRFAIFGDWMNYANASAKCYSIRGRLGFLKTQSVYECIKKKLGESLLDVENFWFGLIRVTVGKSDWMWTNGEPLRPPHFSNWGKGTPEPNNLAPGGVVIPEGLSHVVHEGCASLSRFQHLDWNDLPCRYGAGLICELP